MSKPTTTAIRTYLAGHGVNTKNVHTWATFLTGLDWKIIKPLVQMATSSGVHPALAAGMVAQRTSDQQTQATLLAHLETKGSNTSRGHTSGETTTKDTPTQ